MDVAFAAGGLTLRGWLYKEASPGDQPAIVMSHGFGAYKEMGLEPYAEAFCDRGFAVLVYDHRNLGASDGEPRDEIHPMHQVDDMRDAITFLTMLPGIDPGRIGLWGTSFSGGHALMVAAIDRRIRCVVSQVPTISSFRSTLRTVPADRMAAFRAENDAERVARAQGKPPRYIPIASEGTESFEWAKQAGAGTGHRNRMTLLSRDLRMSYDPGVYIRRISPTPLLMIVATEDLRCPTDDQLAAYNEALEPKRLLLIEGGHYSPYVEKLEETRQAAADWFAQHLFPAMTGLTPGSV